MSNKDARFYLWLILVLFLDCALLIAISYSYRHLRHPLNVQASAVPAAASESTLPKTGNIITVQQGIRDLSVQPFVQPIIPNFNLDYDVPPVGQRAATVRVPVLIYHHIGPVPGETGARIDNVTPEILDQQLQYLQEKQYAALTMDQYIESLQSGANPVQKSVLITFDDGYIDQYQNALPLLKKYGFTATFFIPVTKSEISPAQLKEMSDAGMDIESHTMTHYSMTRANNTKTWQSELVDSQKALEAITGKPVKAFAYPYCYYSAASLDYITKQANYTVAFACGNTQGNSIDQSWGRRLVLFRSWQYNDLRNFIDRLSGIEYRPADNLPNDTNGFKIKLL